MLLKFLYKVFTRFVFPLLAEYNSGLHHHATDIIWHTSNGALNHGRVSHQGALYFERTDAVTRRLDNIVDTSFEPVVTIFVTPGHVTSMINAVVPCLAGLLFITVVTLEQTNRLLVAYAYHNLTFLTILTAGTIGTKQIDIILGVGDTHRTGFRGHPREGAERHGCLCLTKALHHADAGLLVELIIDGRVQGLACSTAILETAQIVFAQILTNHKTVDGGGSTETGNLIFLHLA